MKWLTTLLLLIALPAAADCPYPDDCRNDFPASVSSFGDNSGTSGVYYASVAQSCPWPGLGTPCFSAAASSTPFQDAITAGENSSADNITIYIAVGPGEYQEEGITQSECGGASDLNDLMIVAQTPGYRYDTFIDVPTRISSVVDSAGDSILSMCNGGTSGIAFRTAEPDDGILDYTGDTTSEFVQMDDFFWYLKPSSSDVDNGYGVKLTGDSNAAGVFFQNGRVEWLDSSTSGTEPSLVRYEAGISAYVQFVNTYMNISAFGSDSTLALVHVNSDVDSEGTAGKEVQFRNSTIRLGEVSGKAYVIRVESGASFAPTVRFDPSAALEMGSTPADLALISANGTGVGFHVDGVWTNVGPNGTLDDLDIFGRGRWSGDSAPDSGLCTDNNVGTIYQRDDVGVDVLYVCQGTDEGWVSDACRHVLHSSVNPTEASATPDYMSFRDHAGSTTENDEDDYILPDTMGKLHSLHCTVDVAPGAGNDAWTITLRDDQADTALTCDIDETATDCTDNTNIATPAADSLLDLSIDSSGPDANPANAGDMFCTVCMSP